ncbi:hypothetical protein I4U23_024014 [Adineta vaga]|nr:hypothetical protein I4U23_024014 [Adineta vaga]
METKSSKNIIVNTTIINESIVHHDTFMLFAGHLLLIFYCLIFLLGLLGNSAVIFVAIRKYKYRNVTNCYVINLALADLLFLIVSIPPTTYLGLVNNYPFSEIVCKIHTYLAYVFLLATCNTLAAMSIDRYYYIVLPKSKLQWRTPYTAFLICLVIWASSLAFIVPYHFVLYIVASNYRTCGGNNHDNFLVCFLVFSSYYAIPLVIIIVCYTKLAMHVIQSNQLIASHLNTKSVSKFLKKKQRRVTRMVIVVTLVFALCWLPIHILELMKCANVYILYTAAHSHPKVLYTIRAFSHALAYFNSCLNPYLYAILNRNFCFDLINIIPSYFTSCKQSKTIRISYSNPNTRSLQMNILSTEDSQKKQLDEDDEDDDEMYYNDSNKEINTDVINCHVELLRI